MASKSPTTNSAILEGNPFSALASTTTSAVSSSQSIANEKDTKNNNTSVQQTNPPAKSAVTFAIDNDTNNTPVARQSTENTTNEGEEEQHEPLLYEHVTNDYGQNSPTSDYGVTKLREDLLDVQRKLEKALRLQSKSSSDVLAHNKHAGHVDVDFVRTKPSKRSRMKCKSTPFVKTILHNFHAEFPEGCVTALMGPSGAGKTTLLDFLTGMLGDSVHASGQVALPDNDAYVPQDDRLHGFYTCQMYMEHYARLVGMKPLIDCCSSRKNDKGGNGGGSDVEAPPQDNSQQEHQSGTNNENVQELITTILSEVGLSAQRNTVVGGLFKRGLSGGQKRRLSVALEALSSPLNLFLDEPTSGLDSESALALMQYLSSYARGRDPTTGRRRRVIVTIHQPSSQIWETIDNVVLLAEGRLMYQGPRKDMNDFFSAYGHPVPVHYNPADHFIESLFKMPEYDEEVAASDNIPEMWSRCFRQHLAIEEEEIRASQAAATNTPRPGMSAMGAMKSTVFRRESNIIRQDPASDSKRVKLKNANKKLFRSAIELTRRSFVNLVRNPIVLGLRVIIYGGMSLVIGVLFFRLDEQTETHAIIISRTGILYFIIAFCSSMSVAQIPFAMIDRGIVQKEVRNHLYHPALYHASQMLAGVPVALILSLLVAVIILNMTGLQGGVSFWFILFMTFLCADATSMFVAHITSELISAIVAASGIFGVFTMIMGFLVTPSNFPRGLGWLYYIPFMTYSFRSMMYEEYHNLTIVNVTNLGDQASNKIPGNSTMFSDAIDDNKGSIESMLADNSDMASGDAILKSFEMENTDIRHDMLVLIYWALITHAISILYLSWRHFKSRRMFIYSD